ncbi:MAG: hypothetical protein V2I26_16240 [Halieaceae bacterium]|jgi:hypothetical protein|nr:hypothetical protein [Halieaceae bacterium]
MKKLVVGLALLALSGLSVNAFSDDDDREGKTSICHKGRTVTISQSGVPGHLAHGDSMGSCEERRAAVVMMQCQAEGDDIKVVAVSSSETVAVEIIPVIEGPCADALAKLLDARMEIKSVTAGSAGTTDYLLLGYAGS